MSPASMTRATTSAAYRRLHVVVLTRWRARYAEYDRYVDHDRHRVTYVATDVALPSIPRAATDTWPVASTDDLPSVRAGVQALATRYGAPDRIIALKEDDLLVAAGLRAEWGCPGPTPSDLAPFRDKLVMSTRVAEAGLPVEPFAAAPDAGSVLEFAGTHGWPVIVKPRCSSASDGVVLLSDPHGLPAVDFGAAPLMVQAYNPHPIYHVDGLYARGRLVHWRAARYLNTCLDFRHGACLGSVEEDDPRLNDNIGGLTERLLRALTAHPLVFHLEMFVDSVGNGTFLEVGARVGGGETALLWREVHGYDLMAQAFRIQFGLDTETDADADVNADVNAAVVASSGYVPGAPIAGHLLVPAPLPRPCRITHATPMLGRQPGLYAEVVPKAGEVLPAADSYYEHVGGRFRFRGLSTKDVEAAIIATARQYRVAAEPVTEAPAGHHPAPGGSKACV